MNKKWYTHHLISGLLKKQLPIQWIMLLNVVVIALVILTGSVLVFRNIEKAREQNRQNLIQSLEAGLMVRKMIEQHIPLRKLVARQKILVERFTYEFEIFVLEETGDIEQLEKSVNRMLANQRALEAAWVKGLATEPLERLRGNVNMALGIYEEAAEYERVGFGELHSLAEESKTAVDHLKAVMDQVELILDYIDEEIGTRVLAGSRTTADNEKTFSARLGRVIVQNYYAMGAILILVIIFQIAFFLFLKNRLEKFKTVTTAISEKRDLSQRVNLSSDDELGLLASSFNQMLEKLNRTMVSRDYLDNIIRSMAETLIAIDTDATIRMVNTPALKMLGYAQTELIGRSIDIILENAHAVSHRRRNSQELLLTCQATNTEKFYISKDNRKIPMLFSGAALYDEKGEVIGVICIAQDLTERKKNESERTRLQEQIQRGQKMEAIGNLAGGVAHDLNNILSGIVSYPELILLDLPQDSPLRDPILTIKHSGDKASAIVQDLLTLARRGVSAMEVLNLNDIVTEYVDSPELKKLKADEPDNLLEIRLAPHLLNMVGSHIHLMKTLMNLLTNAYEATANSGTISITTMNRYIDRPMGGYEEIKEGEYVILKISDNGIGIPEQHISRIFEPFYSKKKMGRSGTGLGMAVVWGTVKDLNGYIDVESEVGKGTTFSLYFPASRKQLPGARTALAIEDYMGNGESILVVDDVAEQRKIAGSILKKLNYSVDSVASGEEAVGYMRHRSPALIVMDMIMGPGIDGCEAYKRIIAINPNQKAIIASGFSQSERVNEAQRLGASQYVRKPYTIEKIGMATKKALE